jgi:hypothetical protein
MMSMERTVMVDIDIDAIIEQTGLSPRAICKVTGMKWSHFQKIRKRGTMHTGDAILFRRKLEEHRQHGTVNPEIRNRRGELVTARPAVKFRPNLPMINEQKSAPSEELERLGRRAERVLT